MSVDTCSVQRGARANVRQKITGKANINVFRGREILLAATDSIEIAEIS